MSTCPQDVDFATHGPAAPMLAFIFGRRFSPAAFILAPPARWCALDLARCYPARWFAGHDAGWCPTLDPWTCPHCWPEGTFAHHGEPDE